MAAYLRLSRLVLGAARFCVRAGWRSKPVLGASLQAANGLSRAALRCWRAARERPARSGANGRKLAKRSVWG